MDASRARSTVCPACAQVCPKDAPPVVGAYGDAVTRDTTTLCNGHAREGRPP